LESQIVALLTPSTSQADLLAIPLREGTFNIPFLRLKQNDLNQNDFFSG
jgi:hypothetical protein